MATSKKLIRAHAAFLASLDLLIKQASDPEMCEASAPEISGWSVKDHLEHLSYANETIVSWIERAREGDPELDQGGRPSVAGRIVLLFGAFPRGRGKAPERTRPKGTSAVELLSRFSGIRERVGALAGSLGQLQASNATRNHFAFGDLDAVQWIHFSVVHNHHHQKIIRDVLGANPGAAAG